MHSSGKPTTKVAVTQKPPVLLNLNASIDCAQNILHETADAGAQLVMFPETFLPGYPHWCWQLIPDGKPDRHLGNEIHNCLRRNAVDLAADDLLPLQETAARLRLVVGMGMNELDSTVSGSTLFNTYVIIGADGRILNRHRKLMPTNPERMVWGLGDGSGLRVVDTSLGRIGCLICWENYMPLSRFALYAQSIDIYLAPTWDSGDTWLSSMIHIAKEGGCWVLSSATAMKGSDVPANFPGRTRIFDDNEWINPGDAIVIKPGGGTMAGPLRKEHGILYADIDVGAARASRKDLDVTGHYSRSDIFSLEVDRTRMPPVTFIDESPQSSDPRNAVPGSQGNG
jgi:nitrilase